MKFLSVHSNMHPVEGGGAAERSRQLASLQTGEGVLAFSLLILWLLSHRERR